MFRLLGIISLLMTSTSYAATIEVQRNDTLSGLAAEHLGSSASWQSLCDANRSILKGRCEMLMPGMILTIPNASMGLGEADRQPEADDTSNLLSAADNLLDSTAWKFVNGISAAQNSDDSFRLEAGGKQDPFIFQRIKGPLQSGEYLFSAEFRSVGRQDIPAAAKLFGYLSVDGAPLASTVQSLSMDKINDEFASHSFKVEVPAEFPQDGYLVFRIDLGDANDVGDTPPKGYSLDVRAPSVEISH